MASLLNMSGGSLLNKGLPYDAEIEYLESSGTQWIDTLYKLKLYDELKFKVYCFSGNGLAIFGARGSASTNFYQLYIQDVNTVSLCFGQTYYSPTTINGYQRVGVNEIIIKNGLCVCNEVNTSINLGVEDSLQNLAIFARRNQDSTVSYKTAMRLYYFKIYSNDILVRDFIPVRVGQVGYLYDKVSGTLFGNAGTGDFILGNDI